MLHEIILELVKPAFYPLLAQTRLFWMYLCSAIGIALIICYWRQPAGARRSMLKALQAVFPRRIFAHRSAFSTTATS
jgi:hypothetical protein